MKKPLLFTAAFLLISWNINAQQPPVADFYCDTVSTAPCCFNFFDISLNAPTSWNWSFPGGIPSSSSAQNPMNICYPAQGIYNATLIVDNGFGIDTTVGIVDAISCYCTTVPSIVEFITYNGIQNGTSIEFDWATAAEMNTDYFDIERSIDNVSFSSTGTVTAAGTSVTQQNYSYSDNGPFVDTCYYYRLKTVYIDASFEYTDTLTVCYSAPLSINENEISQTISIYPNPTTGQFTISSGQGAIKKVEVFDLFGRKVLESKEPEIDMSSYPAGLYIWSIGNTRGKLIIEH